MKKLISLIAAIIILLVVAGCAEKEVKKCETPIEITGVIEGIPEAVYDQRQNGRLIYEGVVFFLNVNKTNNCNELLGSRVLVQVDDEFGLLLEENNNITVSCSSLWRSDGTFKYCDVVSIE